MFRKVLVALDTSDIHRHVFEEALAIAQAHGSTLMLLHVLSPDDEDSPGLPLYSGPSVYPVADETYMEIYRQRWEEYEAKGLELLKDLTDQATAAGLRTEYSQNMGNAGQKICQFAQSWSADLIVMGRRGRSGLSELFLGSSSNYVMHHATCSVLIVQGGEQTKSAEEGSEPEMIPVNG